MNKTNNIIPFISRHEPSEAQRALVASICPGKHLAWDDSISNVQFTPGEDPLNSLCAAGLNNFDTFAIVAPTWVLLDLILCHQKTLIVFKNSTNARGRGVFLCRGAWKHGQNGSQFFDTVIPVSEQEEKRLV